MGAHGTLEEALRGVAAFNAPSSEDEELKEKRQRNKSKARKQKHKKGKDSRKKEKKEKYRKHKKDKNQSSEDEDSGQEDIEKQLERGRSAVRITREILQQQPGLKQELRQVGSGTCHAPSIYSVWLRGASMQLTSLWHYVLFIYNTVCCSSCGASTKVKLCNSVVYQVNPCAISCMSYS
jgi:hypothetical protein